MEKLINFEKLVHPIWLNNLINMESENKDISTYKIFDVSWGQGKYKEGHIPGAFLLDTNVFEEEPLWNRVSDAKLEKMLLSHGITTDTTVILYGRDNLPAYRAALILLYAGVKDVRILNGGYKAWIDSGLTVETVVNQPKSVSSFGAKVPSNPQYIIDTAEVKKLLETPSSCNLVSIRTWAEHTGETSGYSYIEPKGRIPGDVWGHAGSNANNMDDYINIDQTMRNF